MPAETSGTPWRQRTGKRCGKRSYSWRDNDAALRPTLESEGLLAEAVPLSANLTRVALVGLAALDHIEGRSSGAYDAGGAADSLKAFKKPVAEVLLMAVPGVNALVAAAAESNR